MRLRIIISVLSLVVASTSMAGMSQAQFYIGAQGGANMLQVDRDANTAITLFNGSTVNIDNNYKDSAYGIAGGPFMGITVPASSDVSLGLEVGAQFNSTKAKVSINNPSGFQGQNVSFTQQMLANYTVAFVPAIVLSQQSQTRLYLRAGYTLGYFKFDDKGTTTFDQAFRGDFNKYLSGVNGGVGISTQLSQNVGLRLEYDYAYFGKVHKTSTDPFTTNTTQTTFRPTSNTVQLGLYYSVPFSA